MVDRLDDFFKELKMFCEKSGGEYSESGNTASCRFYETAPLGLSLIKLIPSDYGENMYLFSPETGAEFDFSLFDDETGKIEMYSTAFKDGWIDSIEIHESGGRVFGMVRVNEVVARRIGRDFVLKLL